MKSDNNNIDKDYVVNHKHVIHNTLAHSYSFHLIVLLFGVVLDLIFSIKIFENHIMMPIGFLFLFLATVLIVWAQFSSSGLEGNVPTQEHFSRGPYCYTRTPTHYGLFLLILGFGFIMNAFFIIVLSLVSMVFGKSVYLKKYEEMMVHKFGTAYEEYKKKVKL